MQVLFQFQQLFEEVKGILIQPADMQRGCIEALRQKCVFYFCAWKSGALTFSHFFSVTLIYSRTKIDKNVFHRYFFSDGLRAGFCHESHFGVKENQNCILGLKVWGKLGFKFGFELFDCTIFDFVFPCR